MLKRGGSNNSTIAKAANLVKKSSQQDGQELVDLPAQLEAITSGEMTIQGADSNANKVLKSLTKSSSTITPAKTKYRQAVLALSNLSPPDLLETQPDHIEINKNGGGHRR